MAYCKNCGSKLEDGAKFCPQCGTQTTEETPEVVSNEAPRQVSSGSSSNSNGKIGCWTWFFIIFLIGYFVNKCSDDSDSSDSESKTEQVENKATKEETHKEENPIAKYVGTYRFVEPGFPSTRIVVTEDGRCVKKEETLSTYLGKVEPVSEKAFKLQTYSEPWHFYINLGYDYDCTVNDVVFDISEKRLYNKKSEYDNRDIAGARSTKFTYEKTVEDTHRKCATCGIDYIPDDASIYNTTYCGNDCPQTCNKCGKTFTHRQEGHDARFHMCARCASRDRAVKLYESATGRKVQ